MQNPIRTPPWVRICFCDQGNIPKNITLCQSNPWEQGKTRNWGGGDQKRLFHVTLYLWQGQWVHKKDILQRQENTQRAATQVGHSQSLCGWLLRCSVRIPDTKNHNCAWSCLSKFKNQLQVSLSYISLILRFPVFFWIRENQVTGGSETSFPRYIIYGDKEELTHCWPHLSAESNLR